MILLEHIAKARQDGRKKRDILVDVHAALDLARHSIGILGAPGSGKTTLMEIIAGVTAPDAGRVRRGLRVSWPLSWRGFKGRITGAESVEFLARLHGFDRRQTLRYVAEVSRLDRHLYRTMGDYTPQEKDRLMQACALALDFDVYLVDETIPSVGPGYAEDYDRLMEERLRRSHVLIVSSRPGQIGRLCTEAAVLHGGRLGDPVPWTQARDHYLALGGAGERKSDP